MDKQPIFAAIADKDTIPLELIFENASPQAIQDIEDARTSTGLSVLAMAIILKKWPTCQLLMSRFPSLLNIEDREGLTPL